MERQFRRYLDCSILAHGFARNRCGDCGHTVLIAFSCKGRGVDEVFPVLPVRQWVLSIPKRLRYFLQRDPTALSAVLHIFLRVIEARLRERGRCPGGRLGAVSFVHGADAAGVVLAERPDLSDEMTLLVDIGTNAEIVLGNRKRLLACSSPTGPA